jgi:hypothetical protein
MRHSVLAGFTARGGSRDETWRGQGISKRSMSWNLSKFDICRVTKGAHIEHL